MTSVHDYDQEQPVLSVRDLVVEYRGRRGGRVQAVSGVSFDLRRGETFGLVGESGCGKSSLARAVIRLVEPKAGALTLEGRNMRAMSQRELRKSRGTMQMIFQDPISSLNPRRKVGDIIAEGLDVAGDLSHEERDKIVRDVMESVGLDPDATADRFPYEFSGGQCQRVSIGRALATNPSVVVCDEPVSALDVSVQAQVLNLLEDMKVKYGLTLLFIAHDLAVVKNVSDRIGVMYLGKLCEVGDSEEIYRKPLHPYTRALWNSIPDPKAQRRESELSGDLPSPLDPPSGCRFRTRCPLATELCAQVEPEMREVLPGRQVACHFPLTSA